MGAKVEEVTCIYCGKRIVARHIKLGVNHQLASMEVCNECFILASNGKI